MKNYEKILIWYIAISLLGLQSCENYVPFGDISPDKLPSASIAFIEQHFSGETIFSAEKELNAGRTVYDVKLSDGTEVTFDEDGEWKGVNCGTRQVPDAIIPTRILDYVTKNFPDAYITEIEYKYTTKHYKVELNIDAELRFDKDGNFVNIDY